MSGLSRTIPTDAAAGAAPASLAEAFVTFEEASRTLAEAYDRLEGQFRRVNRELEHANRELSRSFLETETTRRLLDRILASVPCGILSCDLGGIVSAANVALTTLLGRPEGSLLGRHYDETIGGWEEIAAAHLAPEGRGRPPIVRERTLRRAGGEAVVVESTVSPLVGAGGEAVGIVEVVKDLSDVRRLEEAVREARTLAALGEMAAGLAHEIRNPLGGIAGFASLLARDLPADDPRARTVARIVEGVDALNRIVTDFLAFGAPGAPEARAFDAADLAGEVLAHLEAERLARPGVSVETRRGGGNRLARADRDQVRQALLNIARNALEATPEGGRVRAVVEGSSEAVVLAISDTGPGIPEAVRGRLFRPFGSTKPGGTGLGLAVARTLLERNGGSLGIETGDGGTTVIVRLPAAEEERR